ncbi:MAG: hypothetical protein ABSB33_11955 [Tepidisphaeraceae bacterium]
MLRLILRRAHGRFAGRGREVCIGDLQVVFLRHGPAVADPLTDDVQRVLFGKLCLPGASQIVPQFRPGRHARLVDDALQLRPQILARVTVAGNDEFRARLGLVVGVHQRLFQFGKQRNESASLPFMGFGLWRRHADAPMFKVDVSPPQRKMFRWTPKPAEPRQRKEQPPFVVRAGVQHLLRHVAANEVLAGLVGPHGRGHAVKRVVTAILPTADRGLEQLPCPPDMPADAVFA